MAAGWLYKIDSNGVHVTPEFMERLRNGDPKALRSINKQNLTALYRLGYSRQSRRADAEGLYWSDDTPVEVIPFVQAGRHPPPSWVKDGPLMVQEGQTAREVRGALAFVRTVRRSLKRKERDRKLPPSETTFARVAHGKLEAWYMKANPKFELVVINKHDRGTLLKLLSELDRNDSVDAWLTDRTDRKGASFAKALYADYSAWCEKNRQAAVGIKTFAQELVAAGVAKLTRSSGGERYELELRV